MLWLLANLLIRSALILGAGALLCRLLSRLCPSQRHRILLSAFMLLLCWPVLAALLPEIAVPLWKHSAAVGRVNIQQFVVARRAAGPSSNALAISPVAPVGGRHNRGAIPTAHRSSSFALVSPPRSGL